MGALAAFLLIANLKNGIAEVIDLCHAGKYEAEKAHEKVRAIRCSRIMRPFRAEGPVGPGDR